MGDLGGLRNRQVWGWSELEESLGEGEECDGETRPQGSYEEWKWRKKVD